MRVREWGREDVREQMPTEGEIRYTLHTHTHTAPTFMVKQTKQDGLHSANKNKKTTTTKAAKAEGCLGL